MAATTDRSVERRVLVTASWLKEDLMLERCYQLLEAAVVTLTRRVTWSRQVKKPETERDDARP